MPAPQPGAVRESAPALSPEIVEQLRQVTASPLDEARATRALTIALEVVKLKCGALLRYDSEAQSLSLLAQEGLSEAALDAIRLIRRGVSGVWDMPLHAVLQRRVYIIDRPKENPFVPNLISSDQGILTNAALMPLFAGGAVTGSLLLVGSGKRIVHEADILALREVAKAVGAALKSPARQAPRAPHVLREPIAPAPQAPREDVARDRAMLVARVSELESLVESLRRAASGGPSQAEIDRRIAEVSRERDRYKSDAERHELALRALRSESELLRGQGTNEAERARRLAVDLARLKQELDTAKSSGERSLERLEDADRTRADLEQRLASAERQLADTANRAHAGEATRAELASRVSIADIEAEGLRKNLKAREDQVAELRGERDRLSSALQKATARYQSSEDALAQVRESSEASVDELRAEIGALRTRAEGAERERDQVSAGLAGRSEILAEIERETERYRAELEREIERRRVAEQTIASVLHDATELRQECERLTSDRQAAQTESTEAGREIARLGGELAALRASSASALAELRAQASELTQKAGQAEAARTGLATDLERLRPELEALRRTEAELRSRAPAREESERKLQAEVAALRRDLDEASESARAAIRERDALLARVATLDDTTAKLLREAEGLRAERERLVDERQKESVAADARHADVERMQRQIEELKSALQQGEDTLAERERAGASGAAERAALERELAALRAGLQESQSRGSELTVELARLARSEEELRAAEARLRETAAEREELADRVRHLESALEGASANLAEKSREGSFATVLRATLAKSEAARRAAEDGLARFEGILAGERAAAERLRAETESERETARDLAQQLQEIERRLAEFEEATAEANQRAALAASAQAASEEAAQKLAADLGRRTAEIGNVTARLESAERSARDWETALATAQARTSELEEVAREAKQGIDALRRQADATQDEKDRRIHELDLQMAESAARTDRLAAQLKATEQEREQLRESIRALDAERAQAGESAREVVAKLAATEVAARRGQAEAEHLAAEIEGLRSRAGTLENDVREREAESERWRALAERLQGTLEEREREVEALRAGARAMPTAASAPAAAAPTPAPAKPAPARPAVPLRPQPPRPAQAPTSKTIVILDEPGQTMTLLTKACESNGFEPRPLDNGTPLAETPGYTAVNLLSTKLGGFEGLLKSRTDELLASSRLLLYASKPGGNRGVVFSGVECLIRPIEEKAFVNALSMLLGNGKRVTIIGEELDSVLKLNAWATAKGCSVSSAGDLKQGNEILDIVKPDLIVFDFSRLGGEGATLVTKVRRSARLEPLPILFVLPPGAQSNSAPFFLKRLAALSDEAALDFGPIARRLAPPEKT